MIFRFFSALLVAVIMAWIGLSFRAYYEVVPVSWAGDFVPQSALDSLQESLISQFDLHLEQPQAFYKRVMRECRFFPEGDLFPFLYPALAYINMGLHDPSKRHHSIRQAAKLIDMALRSVTRVVKPPNADLLNLRDYGAQAVYLGQLNMVLGSFRLLKRDSAYALVQSKISLLLARALKEVDARPLRSFPSQSWPFDTIPVVISLSLFAEQTGRPEIHDLVEKHLSWVKKYAMDKTVSLPFSQLDPKTLAGKTQPRGCDLSFRISLLSHLYPGLGRELYENYVSHYWLDRGPISGFSEWPEGKTVFEDADSGPIFWGIGMGATGLGIGAMYAMQDKKRLRIMMHQLGLVNVLRPLFWIVKPFFSILNLSPQYFSGFLFGDAMLVYGVSWRSWKRP